ncbi:MAG: ABC transporter substrate-binding protein, partial [Epsilonproteobacteria bacterium]|nr:ABC transporter substrate-binding protein [Campylobacterota bacterium]
MHRLYFAFALCVTVISVCLTPSFALDPLVYAAPNPPFSFRDKGEIKGLSVDLLEASLSTLRSRFSQDELTMDAWNKMYEEALKHPKAYLMTAVKLKDREPHFYWLGPVATVT